GLTAPTAVEVLCESGGWNETKAHPPWDEGEMLELAESLEPSREQPIGCASAAAQFETVELHEIGEPPNSVKLPPLTLAWWDDRDLPEPTFMCGRWLTTTSRVIVNAPTGLGKSMWTLGLGMAIAAQRDFLHWKAAERPFRVLYIDGEMSNRLLRDRLRDERRRLGCRPETFYALSHEDIQLQPLNTPGGQKQIEQVM